MPEIITLPNATTADALHRLTFADLKRAAQHALTKPADETVTSLGEIVNDALVQFTTLADWQWLRRGVLLDTVADQAFIELPADFANLLSVRRLGGYPLRPVSPDTLNHLRQNSTSVYGGPSGAYYCVRWESQASTTDLPAATLQLYPTPSQDEVNAVGIVYLRQLQKLSTAGDIPDIPAYCHQALKAFVRAHALAEDHQANAAGEMERAMALVQRAVERDGLMLDSLGEGAGAADEFDDREPTVEHRAIVTPI